jgi:O-antigen/teichoic acid export membrane protein
MITLFSFGFLQIFSKLLKASFELLPMVIFGASEYATFLVILSAIMITSKFLSFGLPNAQIKYLSTGIKSLQVKIGYLMTIQMSLIMCFLPILILLAFCLKLSQLTIFASACYAMMLLMAGWVRSMDRPILFTIAQDILFYVILIGFYIILSNFISTGAEWSFLISSITIMAFIAKKCGFKRPLIKVKILKITMKRIAITAIPMWLTGFGYMFISRYDVIFLTERVDGSVLGAYAFQVRIILQIMTIQQIFVSYFMSKVSRRITNGEPVSTYLKRMLIASGVVTGIAILVFEAFIFRYPYFFNMMQISLEGVNSEQFKNVRYIYYTSLFFYSITFVFGYLIYYYGFAKIEYLNILGTLIGFYFLLPTLYDLYGLEGAAIAVGASIFITNLIQACELLWYFKIRKQ